MNAPQFPIIGLMLLKDVDLLVRLEICRNRRDRRLCKIFVSCVNFSRKQRSFLHILQVYTHLKVNFLHNCQRIYIFCSILTKRGQNY